MYNELQSLIGDSHVRTDTKGPLFSRHQVNKNLIVEIATSNHLQKRGKLVKEKIDEVTAIVDEAVSVFSKSIDRLVDAEKKASDKTKQISGALRDNAEKLMNGLARVEKLANFDRLENYVVLLERAASAMSVLAELEKTGKLEKIASAIR